MDVINAILAVWLAVAGWFGDAFEAIVPMFWTAAETGNGGSLTFLGALSVGGVAVGAVFLLLRVVSNFMQFRS